MLPFSIYPRRLQFSIWIIVYFFLVPVFSPVNATATATAITDGNNGSVAVTANYEPDRQLQGLVEILGSAGYTSLALHISAFSLVLTGWKESVTLFAPSDAAFLRFLLPPDDFSLTRLNHHIAKGIFSFKDLEKLSDGTQMETLAGDGRSLVIAKENASASSSFNPIIYVNGVAVSHPDLYNHGLVAIHGIDRFLPEAPPPLSFGSRRSPPVSHDGPIMPLVLRDATMRLRDRGYSILALALRIKSPELLGLHSLTVFALDDDSIFSQDGQVFVNNVRYHILPNKRLLHADLVSIPVGTGFDTLLQGQRLMVTSTNPFSINGVRLKNPDAFYNEWIAVHGLPAPFTFWW